MAVERTEREDIDFLGTQQVQRTTKPAEITAVKVGVPNLETDLFTNVNKLCPSCNTSECPSLETAWKCTRAQASAQFVHSMCTSLDTTCTLELLLGHFLYTGATAWALLVHYTGTAWPLLVQVLCNKSGHCLYTREILLGYSWYTI